MSGIYNMGLRRCSACGKVYENFKGKLSPCCNAKMRSQPRGTPKYKANRVEQMDSKPNPLMMIQVRKR